MGNQGAPTVPSDPLDVVVPNRPGLHLLLDQPQGRSGTLTLQLAADALDRGTPVIVVLLDEAAPQYRQALARQGTDVDAAEAEGDLLYVDAHAPRVGWAHTNPATVFAETADADSILLALSEAQSAIVERAPEHMVLVSTISSLLVLEGLHATYELSQALASMAPRMGAVTLGRVVSGMHEDQEVTALRHLATTVTDLEHARADGTTVDARADLPPDRTRR